MRTPGQKFVIRRAYDHYRPGEILFVYTYQGEGVFTVWHQGRLFAQDLGFSPYGGSGGKRCTDSRYCWGTLSRDLRSAWWIQMRLPDGRVVWIRGSDAFSGQDVCR